MGAPNTFFNFAGTENGGGNGVDSSTASYSYFNPVSEGSSNPSIQNLTFGGKWGSGTFGSPLTLTYSYSTANSVYSYSGTDTAGVQPLLAAQISTAIQVQAWYANIANITWQEVSDSATSAGDIRWNTSSDTNIETAYADYPSAAAFGGDIWIGPDSVYHTPSVGGYAYLTFLHELGHAMGMNHPHESQVTAQAQEDQLKYSVMSYRGYDGQATNTGYTTAYYPTTLMLNDIATMQFLYGVNTTYQTGNNTYSWAADAHIYETIWDAGGSDTLSAASQAQGCVLYLTSGKWSEIGVAFSNGQSSVRDNLTIAYGCVIENAIGSAYADTIEGNAVANHLNGGAGNDSILGGEGNDTLVGGAGNDTLNGGNGLDWIDYSATAAAVNVALWQVRAGNDGEGGVDALSSIENVRGSNGNDMIAGNSLANYLQGMDGDDTLLGDGGADTLDGGAGIDTIDYSGTNGNLNVAMWRSQTLNNGSGQINTLILIENVRGGSGNDYISGTGLPNKLEGGDGNDTLQGDGGADTLNGGNGSDTVDYTGTNGDLNVVLWRGLTLNNGAGAVNTLISIENVRGGNGNDYIAGLGTNNKLEGGSGNDTLLGDGGIDTLDGGAGIDTIDYSGTNGNLNVALWSGKTFNNGAGAINTLISIEHVRGGNGHDYLSGNGYANKLEGANGQDTLQGDGGADTLDGGAGIDTIDYSGTTGNLNVNLLQNQTINNGAGSINTLISIENVRGGNGNDLLVGNGQANKLEGMSGNDTLQGGAGADTLDGGIGSDTIDYSNLNAGINVNLYYNQVSNNGAGGSHTLISIENVRGGSGDDYILGNGQSNKLEGMGGNDTLLPAVGGADTVDGGAGIDLLDYSSANHTLNIALWNGKITIAGGGVISTVIAVENVRGGSANDMLAGNALANSLEGMGGNDTLLGDGGADTLDGGTGTDMIDYLANSGSVVVNLALNQTSNNGAGVANTLISIENVRSGSGNDDLTGSSVANLLQSNAGHDTINAGDGEDTLAGGNGNDSLTGGSGTDTFRFDTAPNASSNLDTLPDFTPGSDKIQLENSVFTILVSTGALGNGMLLVGAGISSAADSNDYLLYNSSNGALFYDADANAGLHSPIQIAVLPVGLTGLANTDFTIT